VSNICRTIFFLALRFWKSSQNVRNVYHYLVLYCYLLAQASMTGLVFVLKYSTLLLTKTSACTRTVFDPLVILCELSQVHISDPNSGSAPRRSGYGRRDLWSNFTNHLGRSNAPSELVRVSVVQLVIYRSSVSRSSASDESFLSNYPFPLQSR
jgi:hypothetical protein